MIGMPLIYLRLLRYLQFGCKCPLTSRFRLNYVLFRTITCYQNQFRDHFQCFSKNLVLTKFPMNKYIRNYCKVASKCWNCDEKVFDLKFTCQNCNVLLKPDPKMTYFQLMNLSETFDLDAEEISSKYKKLQMIFHPDRYINKSKEEMDISDEYSRLVNKAYTTLRNPLSRGLYMLDIKGVSIDDDSGKMDKAFLLDVLEKNEEVENIKDEESLQKLLQSNGNEITKYIKNASNAFKANNLEMAREVLMKMKYFVNIENEIKKKKSEMGIVS